MECVAKEKHLAVYSGKQWNHGSWNDIKKSNILMAVCYPHSHLNLDLKRDAYYMMVLFIFRLNHSEKGTSTVVWVFVS